MDIDQINAWLGAAYSKPDPKTTMRTMLDTSLTAAGHELCATAERHARMAGEPVATLWAYLVADDFEPRFLDASIDYPEWGPYLIHGMDEVLKVFGQSPAV